ncbi:MAG: glycosyltransferase family 4 protein [Lachnospiraceae bacterium]|nr:glycosyltransferase family 4 protein [Lachnospiraceae bacterium]
MKHILLISQYFHPETFRVNDMACEWVKRGYKVTVLTGIPNYPMGKYYEGYDKNHRIRETWKGVNIIRIPLVARGNSSNKIMNAAGMAANYFSFVRSGKKWVKSKEAENLHADLVFTFEVSPMTQALVGIWYGKRYNVPTYLYVQDLWPENVETVTGIHNRAIIGPIDKMVDKIYRETGTIFTTSPSFVRAIVNRKVPVDKNKVHYWPQYAEEFYRPMKPQIINGIDNNDGFFKIAFTGNIGTAQGLDVLPKAAKLLKDDKVKFVIVGDGRYQPEFEQQIDGLGVRDKFIMIPRVPAERVPEILSVCDAGFISFNKTPLWENTIPAKLQSYMACGKAIIASASGETKRVLEEADCGLCCEIGDANALADGIRTMINSDSSKMGEKAKKYFDCHFNKNNLMNEMDRYFGKTNESIND